MSNIVSVSGITKRFGEFTALHDIRFNIEPGSIVGLIGPNGAGKTTTLKSILGLIDFEGDMEVVGKDPRRGRHSIMENVCFVADVGVLPSWLRVADAETYVAGVNPKFDRRRFRKMLSDTSISPLQKVRQLSKGMVTQLHLALVMSIGVDLLVLDEPTLGLDVLYRKAFYEKLSNECSDNRKSIVISTHQVEEIESVLTHLLFINNGRIILDCAMRDIGQIYTEVLVSPEQWQDAEALEPIQIREVLARRAMIFENVPRNELTRLGELRTPNVTDLFVAKIRAAL